MSSQTTDTVPASLAEVRGARRRERTRTAALDAAERLLGEYALSDIRMEDVAATAGIAPASLYTHFGTKNGLLAATADRLMEVSVDTLRAAYEGDGTPLARVQATGVAYINLLLDHPALIRFIVGGGLRELGSDIQQSAVDRFATIRGEFEQSIQAAVDAKEIQPINARHMSYFLFGAWNGVAELTLRTDGLGLSHDDARAAVWQASTALVRGLTAG